MEVQLDFGASVDIASSDEVRQMGDSVVSRLRRRGKRVLRRIIPSSTVMPAAGPALLDFGQVPAGSIWAVVHCLVTGADDHTAVANAFAALYFGGIAPAGLLSSNLPALGNLLEPGIAVPAVWRYSKEIITGHDGDGLFSLVYGAGAGTNLAGVARVYEWHPDSAEEATYL